MLTEAKLGEVFKQLMAGDFEELAIVQTSKYKFEPYDMCVVAEMGIDAGEKARSEREIDVGNMFRFSGNQYEVVVAAVNDKHWPTHLGLLRYYGTGFDEKATGGIVVCPVLSWNDVGEITLDGVSKLIPSLMVAIPRVWGDTAKKDSVAVGMALGRHLRAGK